MDVAAAEIYRVGSIRRNSSASVWRRREDVFSWSSRDDDDEESLKWATLEKLPTYDRVRKGILSLDEGKHQEVDIQNLGFQERQSLLTRLVRVADEDNERFLLKIRDRIESVGIDLPTIEVRYENLNIEAEAYVGNRGLPTILNSITNQLEALANGLHILPSRKRSISVLHDVSGFIKPRRMTLLLGPPGSGKTSLLLALAGKLSSDLKTASDHVTTWRQRTSEGHPYSLDHTMQDEPMNHSSKNDLVSNPDLPFIITRRKEPKQFRNVYTRRIRSLEQNILPAEASLGPDDQQSLNLNLGLDICENERVGRSCSMDSAMSDGIAFEFKYAESQSFTNDCCTTDRDMADRG